MDVYRGGKLRKMKPTSISVPQFGLAVPVLIEPTHVAAISRNRASHDKPGMTGQRSERHAAVLA